MQTSQFPVRALRLGLAVLLMGVLTLSVFANAPVPEIKDPEQKIKDLEKQIAELNKKLADLKANPKPKERKPLTVKDLSTWRNISRTTLSRDGKWFAYALSRSEGKGELVVRQTGGDKEHRFSADMVMGLTFSHDSQYLAFSSITRPTPGKTPTPGTTTPTPTTGGKTILLRLTTGEKVEYEGASRFAFAGEAGNALAVLRMPTRPTTTPSTTTPPSSTTTTPTPVSRGGDLFVRELATGKELALGNVADFAFDKKGQWLALVIDTQSQIGNGVQLRNMKTGALQVLESSKATFQSLNWTEKGDALLVLAGKEDKSLKDKRVSVVAFTNFQDSTPRRITYEPELDSDFPKGMVISTSRTPSFSEDLGTLFFGIQKPKKASASPSISDAIGPDGKLDVAKARDLLDKTKDKSDKKADLVIWHGNDDRLQSQQQVEATRDQGSTFLCAYRVADKKLHRLADDTVKTVTLAPRQRYAIGLDRRATERSSSLDGKALQDVYVIDIHTGKRQLALKGNRNLQGASPDGTQFLYYADGQFHVFDMVGMKSRCITQGVPTSFINTEDDHNVDRPPTRSLGWTTDSSAVLISDNWDVWLVPTGESPSRSAAVNLTGNGKKDGIRYRFPIQFDPDAKGVDVKAPVYFSFAGEWTKKAGFCRVEPGKPVTQLCFEDAEFSSLSKAREADVFVYTRETATEFPDYYTTNATFKDRKRLTTANPEQENFLWSSGSTLVDYKSRKGERLQGALFLPAGYEKGKKYPTVVYIYERLSQGKNRYLMPRASGFNPALYTSNGYAVLMPDIKYEVNNPGMSAVWCVLPALEEAVKMGVVDQSRVGLQGHSWGGYQTAFLITQTEQFKAAVAGAPLTNLISMYSSIYWNAGIANQPIFESSQGRFTGPYWDLFDDYVRNSPVFHARNVKTPLMMLHNDKDGAVDWNQGIEYFNALRRLNKPVVMLQYKGENHGLVKPANMKDYTVRMKEFFDHHLLGKAAPEWLEKGVPHLQLSEHLDARSKE